MYVPDENLHILHMLEGAFSLNVAQISMTAFGNYASASPALWKL